MTFDDGWTCPCGHEIEPESGDCLVWTPDSWPHFVPQNKSTCSCCGYDVWDIETTFDKWLRRGLGPA